MTQQKDRTIRAETLLRAEEMGVRLEVVGGLTVWEAHPVLRHQKASYRIQQSIRPAREASNGCGCFHYADILVQFPEGSIKRPDIAIFCQEPQDEDAAVTLVPEAVIEILSKDYEAKDLQIGVPFYLAQGIRDVVVLDPIRLTVTHFRQEGQTHHTSPVEIALECGCRCIV